MAENFTAADVPEWTGSLLSYGAFLAYAQRTVEIVRETGYAALALEKFGLGLAGPFSAIDGGTRSTISCSRWRRRLPAAN